MNNAQTQTTELTRPPHRPRVTLRSTCYNHSAFVEQSFDSVARQDFTDIQWIIVDDASTDDSVAKIRGWLGRNQSVLERKGFSIEFYPHTKNRGFVFRLNEIVARAEGTFLCGLSTDDIMFPWRISLGLATLDAHDSSFAVSYSDAVVVNDAGRRVTSKLIGKRAPRSGDLFAHMLRHFLIPAPTMVVRLAALRNVGEYDVNIAFEDYDMCLRLVSQYKFAFCDQPLGKYRLHGGNFHKTIGNADQLLYWMYRKHIHRSEGRERLRRHYAAMVLRNDLTKKIDADFRQLHLPRPPYFREGIRQICLQPRKVARGLWRDESNFAGRRAA
jgi:glycosyltransferase involved in cell wall biosynthesis